MQVKTCKLEKCSVFWRVHISGWLVSSSIPTFLEWGLHNCAEQKRNEKKFKYNTSWLSLLETKSLKHPTGCQIALEKSNTQAALLSHSRWILHLISSHTSSYSKKNPLHTLIKQYEALSCSQEFLETKVKRRVNIKLPFIRWTQTLSGCWWCSSRLGVRTNILWWSCVSAGCGPGGLKSINIYTLSTVDGIHTYKVYIYLFTCNFISQNDSTLKTLLSYQCEAGSLFCFY